MHRLLLAAILLLSSCAVTPPSEVTARQIALPQILPPMKAFSGSAIMQPVRPNSQIAGDFLELSFRLESGRALPVLSRFEGPVTVAVLGNAPAALDRDLERLLIRLRIEAGIDIRRSTNGAPASINLQIIPKAQLQNLVPHAACFVVPNVANVNDFRRLRGQPATDWTRLTTRTKMTIFMPGDVSPQEMRDCLHEEIAQALGPVNDLYRLNDSVFNDDNFHTILTGFDMLILRAYYAPELASGMSHDEVAARLPAILARLNPGGGSGGLPAQTLPSSAAWKSAIEAALGANTSKTARRESANRAVAMARAYGWQDTRLALSLFVKGRLHLGIDSALALAAFREAESIYHSLPGSALQAANMGVQLAAHALSGGHAGEALDIVNLHLVSVMSAENAALLSTLLMIKAEALALLGRQTEAQLVRLDSLGWARYGFGSEAEVSARMDEIAAIARRGRG